MAHKAVFFDRDGTLNVLTRGAYITAPEQIALVAGAVTAVKSVQDAGYLIFIVTNQGIIARGICNACEVEAINQKLLDDFAQGGVKFDAVAYCPHHQTISDCDCRKPKPGMLNTLRVKFDVDFNQSFMVGDFDSDISAGQAAGVRTIKIGVKSDVQPDFFASNLTEASQIILKETL